MKKTWWKEGIVYQIYPRSFKDSSGNGTGDLYGIIEKLDYIKSLGVNMIWICPIYSSPNDDNGYDISDYRKISEEFGGIKAFDILLKEMHKRDLKLIMDLVANHSSDEHKWFQESKKGENNPYHDYYIWKRGDFDVPPNNWLSVFSGSAWQWDSNLNKYYLHLFTKKQPDLNWENPKVRDEIYDVLNFWFSKGVDGFRMDVISFISKRLDFPPAKEGATLSDMMENIYANGPRIHEFLKEMNKKVLSKYDIVTVGEGPGVNLKTGLKYVDENEKELDMVFHFDHLQIDFGPEGKFDPQTVDFIQFKKVFSDWDLYLKNKGWNSIFLGNHDFSRIVSLSGSMVSKPRYYRMVAGACISTLLENNVHEGEKRIISGDVLTGKKISEEGYLGFYDTQICVIPEGNTSEFLGWLLPGFHKFSMSKTFFSWLLPNKRFNLNTNNNGEERAFVVTGQYEKVLPMNIFPMQLIKSIMMEDIEMMEGLGIYEVSTEDFALCEFVCTSKMDVQNIIRKGLDIMLKENS